MKLALFYQPLIRVAICIAAIVCCAELRAVTISSAGTLRANSSASGGLLKLGTGTLTLVANSYTGATNVSAGSLVISGSGKLNNNYALPNYLGNSSGTITVSGNLSLNSGTLHPSNGVIIPSNLLPVNYSAFQNTKPAGYRLTLGNYLPAAVYITPPPSLASQLSLNQNTTAIYGPRPLGNASNSPINISVVPEPTTFALAVLGLGALSASRVLRRVQKRNFAVR